MGVMGTLHYGNGAFELDDVTLAHVRALITVKLRRQESFFLSWEVAGDDDRGRVGLWIDNGVPIWVEFAGTTLPAIDPDRLEAAAKAASSTLGVHIAPTGEFIATTTSRRPSDQETEMATSPATPSA